MFCEKFDRSLELNPHAGGWSQWRFNFQVDRSSYYWNQNFWKEFLVLKKFLLWKADFQFFINSLGCTWFSQKIMSNIKIFHSFPNLTLNKGRINSKDPKKLNNFFMKWTLIKVLIKLIQGYSRSKSQRNTRIRQIKTKWSSQRRAL